MMKQALERRGHGVMTASSTQLYDQCDSNRNPR